MAQLFLKTTISPTSNQSDALAGGGTGTDLGKVNAGSYSGVIDSASNTGSKELYLSHDAVTDPVTDIKHYISIFTQTYGGAANATDDFNELVAKGNASGSSKNNGDGLSGGIWIDMDWDASTTNQFDIGSFPASVKIYGDNTTDGIDGPSAFDLESTAMVQDVAGTPTAPSAPVTGKIGVQGTTGGGETADVLGDNAFLKYRYYHPAAASELGILQFNVSMLFSFTA